jgi:uncharacterized protein (TIGR03067 family)
MSRWVLLLVVPLVWVVASAFGEDAGKKELQLFQGSWEPVFIRNPDGKEAGDEELKAIRLVVKGNEFTLTAKDMSISGTFAIDPSQTPKTIDFVLADRKSADEKFRGVYAIQGERRLSCFAFPKQERPRVIRPSESGYLMFEWKPAAR